MKDKYINLLVLNIGIAAVLAITYSVIFLSNQYSLGMPDAAARMNIARRVVDNITPGFTQLGGVWLPFPMVLYIPLVQIDALYRTGVGAAMVNGILFVIGSYYAFRLVETITRDRRAAFIGGMVYSTSSNLLFFQTTGMSETATITFLLGVGYYLLKWAMDYHVSDLFKSAMFISLVTLTRYEGYAVLALAYLCVPVIAYYRKRKWSHIEGTFILFATLASTGFFLWTIYLWAIFGDPLYWIHIYTNSISLLSFETKEAVTPGLVNNSRSFGEFITNLLGSLKTLLNAIVEMNGLIVFTLGLVGFTSAVWYCIHRRKIWGIVFLTLLGPFFFLIMNLLGSSVPMVAPDIKWDSIFDPKFSLQSEYNIRYALQLLPVFIIGVGFLAKALKEASLILLVLIVLQFASPFADINLLFAVQKRPPEIFSKYGPSINWMNANYDQGKILSSVLANDSIMFHIKVPYKTFIFEGNNKLFIETLNDPTKYATWVMFKNIPKTDKIQGFTDRVGFYLQDNPILLENYDLVYNGELAIYKIKTKPQIELK